MYNMSFVEFNEMLMGRECTKTKNKPKKKKKRQKTNKQTNPLYFKNGQWLGHGSVVELTYTDQHAGSHPQHGKYEQSKQKTWMYGEVRFMLYKMNLWTHIFQKGRTSV